MKKLLVTIIVCLALGSSISAANGKGFGLGIIAGEPTGVTMKLWTGQGMAFDGAIAWSLDNDAKMHIHGDYLFHKFGMFKVEKGSLPFYYGIGARIKMFDNNNVDDKVGIRFPLGLEYLFAKSHFDIFLELVPVLDIAPDTDLDFNGAFGVRYFF